MNTASELFLFYFFKGHLESNAAATASTSQNLTYPFRTVSNSNQIPVPEQDDLYTDNTLNIVSDDGDEDNGSNNSRNTRNSRRHDDGNIDFDFD